MEQTNRTILFEEINPEKGDLLTYIYEDEKESISDNTLQEIHNHLEVSSFEECIEKLKPVMYLCMNTKERRVVCASRLDEIQHLKEEGDIEVYQIQLYKDYPLLKYYIDMIGENGTDLPDLNERIVKMMFPFQDENVFREKYAKIIALYTAGKKKMAAEQMQEFLREHDNALMLLHMSIHLAGEELENLENGAMPSKIFVQDGDDNQIEVSKVSRNFLQRLVKLPQKEVERYENWLDKNLKDTRNQTLLKDIFSIALHETNEDTDALMNLYYQSLDYYIRVIETFWNMCRPLLEKLLGVYAYFAQYQSKKEGMKPKLLITNFALKHLVDVRNRDRFKLFLNSTNGKIHCENVIWYAIMPRLEYIDEENSSVIRERFKGNDKVSINTVNELEEASLLIEMLAEYKIQAFISPIISQHTRADWVLENGVQEWAEYQEGILKKESAEYIYPCFPNFSLSSRIYVDVKFKKNMTWEDTRVYKDGRQQLWLRLPGIEASYVAAGMYAAVQCPVFLAERFPYKIDVETPGIGFRIMENDGYKKLPCTLKSGMFLFPKEMLEEINRKCCGIFFAPFGNKILVVQDRAMSGMYGTQNNVSIVQTLTYIERKIRYETQDFKSTLIEQFFQRRPGSLMAKWNQSGEYYNAILKKGENIQYKLDKENRECIFEVSFEETKCQRKVVLN